MTASTLHTTFLVSSAAFFISVGSGLCSAVWAQPLNLTNSTNIGTHATPSAAHLVDEIVAVVNQEVITRNELNNQVRLAAHQLTQNKIALPTAAELKKQVLERMILERLQLQQAHDNAIRTDDQQLDRAVLRIAEQNHLTLQTLRDRLEAEGITFAKFRENIRQEITLSRLREREVNNRVQVSDSEIEAFIAEQTGQVGATKTTELNLAQILLPLPENASPEIIDTTRRHAEKLLAELRAGADFAQLAAAQSQAPEALQGGDLGWRTQDRWPQLFLDAVATLPPGEIAAPVKSANGFHLLKLLGRRTIDPQLDKLAGPPVPQTHVRHILIRINELVSQQEAQRRLRDLKQRLDNGTNFVDLAQQYSVDSSASKGGDLGWVYPGDTVPEFERAMDALKPGEISDPIETQFGWHLIQVLERRTQQASAERVRIMAREAVRERKADAAYQEWLRQLRDAAFIDIRLDEASPS